MKRVIYINGAPISVSDEVYYTYYKMRRYEKTLLEKDIRNRLTYYDTWHDGCLTPAKQSPSPEDIAIENQTLEHLHESLSLLPEAEYDLIYALFYEGKTITALSAETNVPPRTLGCRRDRILNKLKDLMGQQ